MIRRLYIRDFAIIKELELNFNAGMTVITGETGSGKTLIIKAISIAFGAKCNRSMIRHGSQNMIIEICYDENIIRRIIRKEGPSNSYFNEEPITIKDLKDRTKYLIDFHGQNDQQLILDRNYHIYYLDRFCNHQKDLDSLKNIYNELNDNVKKLRHFEAKLSKARDQKELMEFQISEIESVSPKNDEDKDLEKEFKILSNMTDIIKILNKTNILLSEGDSSVNYKLANILIPLEKLKNFDENINNVVDLFNQALVLLEQANTDINICISSYEVDNDRLIEIENRLMQIEKLKRKYGGSISSIIDYLSQLKKDIGNIVIEENLLIDIKNKIKSLKEIFTNISIKLHNERAKKAKVLSKAIIKYMELLEMPNSQFKIKISQEKDKDSFVFFDGQFIKFDSNGFDHIEFYLSTNPGQPVKPLSLIASGGEASRIMLAIKSVFQNLDPVDTLVFDEIDSGISGKAAKKVANHLKQLSQTKQVFCISHLAQIVGTADNHLHINKFVNETNVRLKLKYLNAKESPAIIKELFIGTNLVGS